MITPGDIQRRALRHYYEWLEGIAAGAADFVPLVIKRTGDVRTIDEGRLETMDEVVANSKSKKGYGYNVILDSPGPRSINKQSRIAAIEIETAADLLQFLDKNHEFEQYQRSLALIQSKAPQLAEWCIRNVREICRYAEIWPSLLSVLRFFEENPNPELPLRLLPIDGIDTKFIEKNNSILCKIIDASIAPEYIETRFKLLAKRYRLPEHDPFLACYFNDPELVQYFHGFTALAFPANQLAQHIIPARIVIIIENRSSIYQLLQMPLPETLIIFGGGFGVSLLKDVQWLRQVQLHYWGDLDTHGLAILSQVRGYFPNVRPFRMDDRTFQAHQHLLVAGKPFNGDAPKYLTGDEITLFQYLRMHNLRLEQERLPPVALAEF